MAGSSKAMIYLSGLLLVNNVFVFSDTVTRLTYFLYNSSSMSPIIPGSSGVPTPAVSQLQSFFSFSGYGGNVYTLLSPDALALFSRKWAFVILVQERFSTANKAKLPSLLQTMIRNGN